MNDSERLRYIEDLDGHLKTIRNLKADIHRLLEGLKPLGELAKTVSGDLHSTTPLFGLDGKYILKKDAVAAHQLCTELMKTYGE